VLERVQVILNVRNGFSLKEALLDEINVFAEQLV
jgi:hypothetical protein